MTKELEVTNHNKKKYDGSEMDEIKSPPIKMILALLLITSVGFLYTFTWSFVMNF